MTTVEFPGDLRQGMTVPRFGRIELSPGERIQRVIRTQGGGRNE